MLPSPPPLDFALATPITIMIPYKLKPALLARKHAWNVLARMTTNARNATQIQRLPRLINASATQATSKIP